MLEIPLSVVSCASAHFSQTDTENWNAQSCGEPRLTTTENKSDKCLPDAMSWCLLRPWLSVTNTVHITGSPWQLVLDEFFWVQFSVCSGWSVKPEGVFTCTCALSAGTKLSLVMPKARCKGQEIQGIYKKPSLVSSWGGKVEQHSLSISPPCRCPLESFWQIMNNVPDVPSWVYLTKCSDALWKIMVWPLWV